MESRSTPASRKAGRRARSTVLGLTSSVTSTARADSPTPAPLATPEASSVTFVTLVTSRTAPIRLAIDSGRSSEGVPPPK